MLRDGKLKENALKRSVLKNIGDKRKDIIAGAGIGNDATIVDFNNEASGNMVVSSDPILIPCRDSVYYGIVRSLNNIAAKGGEPVGILLSIMLPMNTEEEVLKEVMNEAKRTADLFGIQISGGHTEVTGAVNYPIVNITAFGRIQKGAKAAFRVMPGDEILLTKWVGLEGTAIITGEKKEELYKMFPKAFVERAAGFREYISVLEEGHIAADFGVSCMHDVSSGGVFGALWEMAEGSGVGLDIDLTKIPLRQETVEICEIYGINPYELQSGGSMLIACNKGEKLLEKFEEEDIPAVIIGNATDGSEKILHNDEEIRYLDRPKADELLKIF